MQTWTRWLADESGQDLLEYVLLTSFLGFAAVAGLNLLGTALNTTYSAWDLGFQGDAYVEVPDPVVAP